MGGVQVAYEYQWPDFFYAGLNFAWRYGSFHASNAKRTLQDFNVYERLGYTFGVPSVKGLVTLFSGFGYRQFRHHVELNDESSIMLRYNHYYLPVGLLTDFQLLSFFFTRGKCDLDATSFSNGDDWPNSWRTLDSLQDVFKLYGANALHVSFEYLGQEPKHRFPAFFWTMARWSDWNKPFKPFSKI